MYEDKLENLEAMTFFEGSKHTHIKAKDYFEIQLN